VKAPTYSNLLALVHKFMGAEVADIPIIAASIDPCMCCMDRVHVADRSGRASIRMKEELIRLSREKTRRILG